MFVHIYVSADIGLFATQVMGYLQKLPDHPDPLAVVVEGLLLPARPLAAVAVTGSGCPVGIASQDAPPLIGRVPRETVLGATRVRDGPGATLHRLEVRINEF
ncbi:hypothetical protein JTE90_017317 [Oedothorax gibbosus]|uniref:Uncharacterized protein n=1 Tax=Oedothorax gibbosus TaxID=931172 RepID=A0AAV6UB44_9ARAC|nr:hypothetical protein JTE90_017317 [Oedothorax gibbosus]